MDGVSTILVNNRLVNFRTYLDWDRDIMGPIKDELGLEQGGANSSDYYSIYSNDNLTAAQDSLQGVKLCRSTVGYQVSQIISAIGLADDGG